MVIWGKRTVNISKWMFRCSAAGTVIGLYVLLRAPHSIYKKDIHLHGRTIIITGATSGIGKESAKLFAKTGAHVVMGCRDMKEGEKVREEIIFETSNRKITVRHIDLSSFDSIRQFATEIKATEKRLDVLVNNAGVLGDRRKVTKDGLEMHLAVNHLGPYLLTRLLKPLLQASAPSRVVIVTCKSYSIGSIRFDDLNSTSHYDSNEAYRQSKLASILFMREASRRWNGITINAVDPGMVYSNLLRNTSYGKSPFSRTILSPFMYFILKTPMQAAQSVKHCALDSELDGVSGKLFYDLKEKSQTEAALDDKAARRLWLISEKWTRLS